MSCGSSDMDAAAVDCTAQGLPRLAARLAAAELGLC
jgi:hypothetical protein